MSLSQSCLVDIFFNDDILIPLCIAQQDGFINRDALGSSPLSTDYVSLALSTFALVLKGTFAP